MLRQNCFLPFCMVKVCACVCDILIGRLELSHWETVSVIKTALSVDLIFTEEKNRGKS